MDIQAPASGETTSLPAQAPAPNARQHDSNPCWPRTLARSFGDLFDLPGTPLHIPRYPSYRPDEALAGDFGYFYRRSDAYLSCQAARFMLLGGGLVTLIDDAGVDLSANVSGYWNGFFREHFDGQIGEVRHYHGRTGYRETVVELGQHPVVCPHPFDGSHIPTDRYALDPHLIVRLNDKGFLPELSPKVPRHQVLSADAFAGGDWRERWPLPFVVKLTEPSGGGDGVVLCRTEQDLKQARQRLAGRQVKVEQLLQDCRNNYNVQLQIHADRGLAYIGGSVQRVDEGRYAGNCIDPAWQPPAAVAEICDQAAQAAAKLGWQGVCGLDLMEDGDGEVWLIDPNFRLNGSTPFYLIDDYLATRHRAPVLTSGYFRYPGPPDELFDRFRGEIDRRELVPIGAHHDPRAENITRIYAAVASDGDPEAHPALLKHFTAKRLLAGIGL